MVKEIFTYEIKTAGIDKVFTHLLKCNENFIPELADKVDVVAYSKKIVENAITFETWIKGELVGLIAAYFNDSENHSGFITSVSTVKEYSGKGIASQLMDMCMLYAIKNNYHEISLEVSAKNIRAIQLYEKYNFLQTFAKDDLIIMKKYLRNK